MVLGLLDQLQIFSVVSDRIARVSSRSGATRAVALDIFNAFDRACHVALLKLQCYGISVAVPQFLILQFSYYTLMTFLTILSVISLSMLMILLSILSVIRQLICGNILNWLLNLNLIYKTPWTGVKSGLLISMLGKLSWFHLIGLMTMVLLM